MARWGLWTATAVGAAGAGLALLRRRRPAEPAMPAHPGEAGGPAPPPVDAPSPGDPQEALDEARERLRARADALRERIEREGAEPPAEG